LFDGLGEAKSYASTSCLMPDKEGVDARDKPGHDKREIAWEE
jgi:hypothetical protein